MYCLDFVFITNMVYFILTNKNKIMKEIIQFYPNLNLQFIMVTQMERLVRYLIPLQEKFTCSAT